MKFYKAINLLIWITLLILFLFGLGNLNDGGEFEYLRWALYWSIGFYIFYIKRTAKLKNISYDSENIYVFKEGQEVVIPFYEIKDIELKSLLGSHLIKFYNDLGLGDEIYFKSSLWYPFNFKKVDDQVYQLQLLIDKSKQQYHPDHHIKSLGSYNV